MKKLILSLSLLFLTHCKYGGDDRSMKGSLDLMPNTGWSTLDFKDGKTGTPFSLAPGDYVVSYEAGRFGFRYPMILISDLQNHEIGRIAIPRKNVHSDGSFELYVGQDGNDNSFNILGGIKHISTQRERYSKIQAYCTYVIMVACTQVSTDSKGNTTVTASMCPQTMPGNEDEVWERETFYNSYRIVFDGADLMNVAVFKADSGMMVQDRMLGSDACN